MSDRFAAIIWAVLLTFALALLVLAGIPLMLHDLEYLRAWWS